MKSSHAKSIEFSLEVCNAIRHHLGETESLKSKRKIAFDDRDHAADAIAKDKLAKALDESDGLSMDELTQHKSQHSDAVRKIDELEETIKFHAAELLRTVKNADTPGLEVMLERPLPPPAAKKPDPDADAPGQLVLGEDASSATPERPDLEIATGVDEHLKATVAELQLTKAVTEKLIELGYSTIGKIARDLDQGVQLDDVGLTGTQAQTVTKAVETYRKAHRKAMLAVELGEDAPAGGGLGGGIEHGKSGGRGAGKRKTKAE
jgi:hypothetical protein